MGDTPVDSGLFWEKDKEKEEIVEEDELSFIRRWFWCWRWQRSTTPTTMLIIETTIKTNKWLVEEEIKTYGRCSYW